MLFFSENVALNKVTSQQQKIGYGPDIELWPSQNAVDGAKMCSTVTSSTVTLSGYSDSPWWQVDLGALYDIAFINVYGRTDGKYPGGYIHSNKHENIDSLSQITCKTFNI